MEKVFPSKIDAWMLVLYWGAILYLLWKTAEAFILRTPPNVSFGFQTILLLSILIAITFLFFYPFRYCLDQQKLIVKGGLFLRETIDLSSVMSTELLTSPANGPALSLKKVLIKYRKDGVEKVIFISPAEREVFVEALGERD